MDQSGISPIGLGGHLPKGEGRGKPYQGSPAHWEGYYYSPSQGKGYFEFYYFVGEPITLGWEKLLKSNTNSIRTVAISEGYDGVRLVEHVCLYFYAILVIADTPEMCSHGLPLHEQPRLPRSGGRHMRSYKGSVEPTHLAHPFRVVLILINHTNAIVYGNPGYNARTEEFQYPVYHVRKSHPATYHP
jgi:hypothetical protein